MPPQQSHPKQRFAFLDVVRAVAVLWMIQVHVTNRIIDPSLKSHWFYFYPLNLSNGFVAPAFIFCAGAGLYIALSRKGLRFLEFREEFWLYLRRLAYILMWAYMLHVPAYSISKVLRMSVVELRNWLQVDVLQTIVYGSLLALGTFFLTRSMSRTVVAWSILAVLVFTCTVFIWQWLPYSGLPYYITMALSYQPPTNFPLLPWTGYLFAGGAIAGWFFQTTNKDRLARWFVIGGLLAPCVIFPLKWWGGWSPWIDYWWQSSPGMHLFRLSGILVVFGALYLIDDKLQSSSVGRFLQITGRESLFMYISHLLIVYGKGAPALIEYFGIGNAHYGTILITWVALTLPLLGLMWLWNRFKTSYPKQSQWVLAGQVVLLWGLFISGWLD